MQLCFLHPSTYKFDHPQFCYERLEYLGQKIQVLSIHCMSVLIFGYIYGMKLLFDSGKYIIYSFLCLLCCILNNFSFWDFLQDSVMAERLLMKHLDAPWLWLQNRHRRFLMNKYCGRYLKAKNCHHFTIYDEKVQDA